MKPKLSYTLDELAEEYNVDKRTIYNWLKPIRKKILDMHPVHKQRIRILMPKQVKLIKEFLG